MFFTEYKVVNGGSEVIRFGWFAGRRGWSIV